MGACPHRDTVPLLQVQLYPVVFVENRLVIRGEFSLENDRAHQCTLRARANWQRAKTLVVRLLKLRTKWYVLGQHLRRFVAVTDHLERRNTTLQHSRAVRIFQRSTYPR